MMKVMFVADWLTVNAGAEHALSEMHELWPDAPIFTTVARPERLGALGKAKIIPSRLQRPYRFLGKHQLLVPWMPRAVEDMDLRGADMVISSSHAVAKGVIPPSSAVHICYCHTPMRYAWEMEAEYLRDFHIPKILHGHLKRLLSGLRQWDLSTAKRVDLFIANSQETARRIRDTYGRDSLVIPPPVSDRFFSHALTAEKTRKGFLSVGRLVPYKKIDLLIAAANKDGFALQIAGTGQEERRLKALAGPTVTFLGHVPDADLPGLYGAAEAVLFAAHEDAGIVPLEAQACGTPVIAYGKGGVVSSVKDSETGIFFAEQTVESLCDAVQKFSAAKFDHEKIRTHAEQFSASGFREQIRKAAMECYEMHQRTGGVR